MDKNKFDEQELLDAGFIKTEKVESLMADLESHTQLAKALITDTTLSKEEKDEVKKELSDVTALRRALGSHLSPDSEDDSKYYPEGHKYEGQRKSVTRLDGQSWGSRKETKPWQEDRPVKVPYYEGQKRKREESGKMTLAEKMKAFTESQKPKEDEDND